MSGSQVQQNKDISTCCHMLDLLTPFVTSEAQTVFFYSLVAEAARSLGSIADAELCLSELAFDKNFSVQLKNSGYSVPSFSAYMQFFIFLAQTFFTQTITRHPKFTEYLKESRQTKLTFLLSHGLNKEKTLGERHTENK